MIDDEERWVDMGKVARRREDTYGDARDLLS